MKISIITINFNNCEGLQKTIESVIYQTYKDIEYIVIDGNSTDGSKKALEQYRDHFAYWVSEPDAGIYCAMNKGTAHASGDYVLYLNSGDCLFDANTIEDVIPELGEEDLVMGKVRFIPSGRIGWDDISAPITLMNFIEGGPVPHQATFIKRSLVERHPYDEKFRIVSDWKFFIQSICIDNCTYKIIPNVITDFMEGGISSNWHLCEGERQQVIKELIPLAIISDYNQFKYGKKSRMTAYEEFFLRLERYSYADIVYTLSVLFTRCVAFVKKSAKFSFDFPIFRNKDY